MAHQPEKMNYSRHGSFANSEFLAQDPFRTPVASGRASMISRGAPSIVESYIQQQPPPRQKRFESARLRGDYDKPWAGKREIRLLYDKIIFWVMAVIGLAIGGYLCYDGWASVGDQSYCLFFEDDFSNGIDSTNWNYEVQRGGFGSGSFDWTTTDPLNAYTDAAGLHIVPTLTVDVLNISAAQILNGYTLNLTADGTCTGTTASDCVITSNSTTGAIINPVRSARLNTMGKQTMLYGKVEIVAKLPKGDWLWPALWMMPEENTYGAWPASGEIDIMESRGNDGESYDGGRNVVSGTVHWGPLAALDMFWTTTGKRTMKRGDYAEGFHVFGVEWSSDYIFTYVDSLLVQTIYMPFGPKYGYLYDRGNFANKEVNSTVSANPWAQSPNYNAPFDRPFYLIMNVAVGGTNGFFPDGYGAKPWQDSAKDAPLQFWTAQPAWEQTWGEEDSRGMTVKSVKMYKPGVCSA